MRQDNGGRILRSTICCFLLCPLLSYLSRQNGFRVRPSRCLSDSNTAYIYMSESLGSFLFNSHDWQIAAISSFMIASELASSLTKIAAFIYVKSNMCPSCLCLRCDECQLCYHFGCLDPPLKKSPKQTGYGWICQECDTSSSKVSMDGMFVTATR